MASSSSEGAWKLDPEPDAWCAADVKEFIAGYSKQRGYSKVLREKLEAAAVTQLTRMRTISAFRGCTFQSKEGKGPLYNLVKALAPPPVKEASDANAYANFQAKHPEVVLPEELAFLLKGVLKERDPSTLVYEIPLDGNQARLLEQALRRKLIPEWLMRPCSFLTFEENLDMRVQVARLWVAASKLPVFVGSSLTFEELRKMDGRQVEKPEGFPLVEDLPSKFLLQMREITIDGIYYGYHVIHPRGEELPDLCTAHRKAYGNVGYPMHVVGTPIYKAGKYDGGLRYGTRTGDPEYDAEEFEDSVEGDIVDFTMSETPAMCKLLAKTLFDREV